MQIYIYMYIYIFIHLYIYILFPKRFCLNESSSYENKSNVFFQASLIKP